MTDLAPRLAAALAGRYRIERALGAGGMATVFLAHDERHARDVAIKVLHPELAAVLGAERFLSEIKTTARLQHPHILPLLDSGEADGLLFYVMPLVTGETLRARIERDRQLPIDEALRYAREVADALNYAHAQGVIHRDIKPENILLQGGHALVADFGIALAVQSAGGERMTQTGMSLGTPSYMSPEQAMGERNIDARCDLYALGAVTYEMLAGEPPFTGSSVQAVIARVISEEPRRLSTQRKSVSPAVEEAVHRALEKLPADRYASAAEFAAALVSTAVSAGFRAPAGGAPSRGAVRVLAGASLVLAAAAAWGWMRPREPGEVLRYTLTVDSITDFRDWTGALAISPDGRTIVHTSGPGGPLLSRTRDQLTFAPVEGTAGAQAPFFSPDGRYVGFFSTGRLLYVPVEGGPPTVLLDSLPGPIAASWGDDGFVYYEAPVTFDGLRRMRAERGAATERVSTRDTAASEADHMLPEALPGGKGVLAQVSYVNGRSAIGVIETGSGRHRVLVEGTRARYLASGHLVYATIDGKLWAVPFDVGSLTTSGTPVQVGEGLGLTMVGPVDFAVSRNGTLVYGVAYASADRELVWVARDGRREPVDAVWHDAFESPRLSPDGRTLAVTVRSREASHIWLKTLPNGTPRRLTIGTSDHDEPEWLPDGRALSYLGSGPTQKPGSVLRQSVSGGSEPELVLDTDRPFSENAWSRTGGWLVVRTTTPTIGGGDILAFRPGVDRAARPIRDSPRNEYSPALSPDGKWMAYVSNETGRLEVFVVPFPEPGNRKWQVSSDGGTAPVWSPRGDELFYFDLAQRVISVPVRTAPEVEVGAPRALFSAAGISTRSVSRRNYDVSADGQRFLMVQRPSGSYASRLVVVERLDVELRRQR